jgi:hypothetical protein
MSVFDSGLLSMCLGLGMYFDHDMYMWNLCFVPLRGLRYFIYMHICLDFCVRCSVYFLNICYIRVFYRFNRNRRYIALKTRVKCSKECPGNSRIQRFKKHQIEGLLEVWGSSLHRS